MNSRTFLWIEDRKEKAGFIFGKRLLQQLCPDIKVESKTNNSELVKAVRNLKDTENRYIIVLDNSFDNLQVALEQKRLREYVEEKTNVALMNIVCFEYILLEFRKLIDWIYAPEDEFHIKRAGVIAAREKMQAIPVPIASPIPRTFSIDSVSFFPQYCAVRTVAPDVIPANNSVMINCT